MPPLVLLAVLAVLNSVVSLYYYLRIPIQLYVRSLPEEEEGRIAPVAGRTFRPMLLLTIVGTLWLGFGPDVGFGVEAILGWVRDALSSLR